MLVCLCLACLVHSKMDSRQLWGEHIYIHLFHIYTATSKSSVPQVWVLAKNICLCLWQTQKHASLSGRAFNHCRSSTNSVNSNIVDMHTSMRKIPCPVHCLIVNHKSPVMHKCVCHGEPCGSYRHWITLPDTIAPPNVQCSSHWPRVWKPLP